MEDGIGEGKGKKRTDGSFNHIPRDQPTRTGLVGTRAGRDIDDADDGGADADDADAENGHDAEFSDEVELEFPEDAEGEDHYCCRWLVWVNASGMRSKGGMVTEGRESLTHEIGDDIDRESEEKTDLGGACVSRC